MGDYQPRPKSMPRPKPKGKSVARKSSSSGVSLKSLAEHLGLSQAAVSFVINRSPAAKSIPHRTQELIRAAAKELNYRPNHLARSLRQQRSFTIGVVVPEISEGYAALVMSGIEDHLLQEGYFYFVVSHRHRSELIEEYLEFVDDVLDELGSRKEVEYVREIMKMGTGADRQLDVYRKTGDMKAVMDYIIEETEVGVDEVDSVPAAKAG